ncbi:hypothetical protein [Limobrevibacterium gyesilva]|uniref:Uncharacterized protein n=1 Tax=Limobrevibacterium gyesilva TaxID=2991712 RepID=A0AA42CG94_9PROT|nr:hypothetical protein [Limobrevibacterium gyesilva]MCW3473600.1 hypothetical protein [Limobrevibacterium gyesilva]
MPNQTLRYAPGGLADAVASEAPGAGTAKSSGEGSRVWVLRDGQPVPLSVVPGLDDETYTDVVKGDLHPGDPIIVAEERSPTGSQSGLAQPRL